MIRITMIAMIIIIVMRIITVILIRRDLELLLR